MLKKLPLAMVATALACSLLATSGAGASQQPQAMVKIAARWIDSGQIEINLEQMSDGNWLSMAQPSQIHLAGDWVNSSTISLGAVGDVRISSRMASDNAELAVQQQRTDGSWGWRVLPADRRLPTGYETGQWMFTSPLMLKATGPPSSTLGAASGQPSSTTSIEPSYTPFSMHLSISDRSFDGTGNNIDNPSWGSTGTALLKKAPVSYADAVFVPTSSRPNPRLISNLVFSQSGSFPNSRSASDITWQWGQFIDHDITLSLDNDQEPFPVSVPQGDPHFDPGGSGAKFIHVDRSQFDSGTGTGPDNPRMQANELTAFIDASQVYGSDEARARALRTEDGTGRLKTSQNGRFLPYNEQGLANEGGSNRADLFVAGDVRVNEQIGLIAMHTLFVREHNRLADIIAEQHPGVGGDEIYQMARKIVGAHIQAITFNDFLPRLLGPDAIAAYSGYDPGVDPTIASEFSAAAYRVGHTLLSPSLLIAGADGQTDSVSLARAFFNPAMVTEHGVSAILRGLASQRAQEIDSKVIDEVRNMLIRGPGGPTFDLVSLNIQRGRDHGLGDYNTVRTAYGLPPAESFADITSDPGIQQALELAYGDIHDMDLWPAALAEDHLPGAMVGETLQAIISDQFRRLRDGDRYWYENDPYFLVNPALLEDIRNTTLADIIRRNTPLEGEIQDNVFVVKEN